MSGGVPKRIQISRTQRNTYCKAGGKDKVQGLVLCSGKRSQKAMCDYIKKRTNTKLSPYFNFDSTGANIIVDGEYTIYDFTSNGQFFLSEQITVDQANSMKRCGPSTAGLPIIEYFMVGGGGAGGKSGSGSGAGGAGGIVKTGFISLKPEQKLNIEVGLGGIITGAIGNSGDNTSIVGPTGTITATGGGGGNPNGAGAGVGGSNADYPGGAEGASINQGGGGAGSAGDGYALINYTISGLANGGPGTVIPANYGISGFFGAGGGGGANYVYPQQGTPGSNYNPPPFFGFGGDHVGTQGPGDGGGPLYLTGAMVNYNDPAKPPPANITDFNAYNFAARSGRASYGSGGGGGSIVLLDGADGGSGRVLIRFKHL